MKYFTFINFEIIDYVSPINNNDVQIIKLTKDDFHKVLGVQNIELDEAKNLIKVEYDRTVSPKIDLFDSSKIIGISYTDIYKIYSCGYFIKSNNVEQIRLFINTLRIYKSNYFIAPVTLTEDGNSVSFNRPMFVKKINNNLKITIKELPAIFSLMSLLKDVNSKLSLNIEWYLSSINQESRNPNSFSNCVGILESLLLGTNRGELKFRFSLYLCHLLKNELQTSLILDISEIKTIYDIRSDFVHSGKSKKYTNNILYSLIEITQKTILFYLKNPDFSIENSINNKLGITEKSV